MGRILAVDYGTKRVGLAVTDTLQIIATALETIHSKDVVNFIAEYVKKEEVECIVIGEPKTMMNKASESAKHIEPFIKHLQKKIPGMKIERYDERFTSAIAKQTMLAGGLKKKARQNKATVDMISATLILQNYLDFIKR